MKMRTSHPIPLIYVCGLFGWLLWVGPGRAAASERAATLEAIRNLENPRNLTRPGPGGELGPYQFRAHTWRMHTTLPFTQALDRATSDRVAGQHYDWIKRGLEKAGLPATPYYVALAWNSGLAAVVAGRSPRVAHHYAERAANLTAAFHDELRLAGGTGR